MNDLPTARRTDWLTHSLHRIAAIPWLYDLIQIAVGARQVYERLAIQYTPLHASTSIVLDLGGGTGLLRNYWPPDVMYICLDTDCLKLQKFANKHPDDFPLLADGGQIPLKDHSVEVILCNGVTHHIPNNALHHFIGESVRVLRKDGRFILFDPVWAPNRQLGKLLWRYDRGSYPRTAEALCTMISNHYAILHKEYFSIYHEYVILVAAQPSHTIQSTTERAKTQ